jgi:hypothetical protein
MSVSGVTIDIDRAFGVPPSIPLCVSGVPPLRSAPGDDCTAVAERAIDGARRKILLSAYRLTVGPGLLEHSSGPTSAVLMSGWSRIGKRRARGEEVDPLAAAGGPVWIEDRARITHGQARCSCHH